MQCPSLVEWTGWTDTFCRLRYENMDVLRNDEMEKYCKSEKYVSCPYYLINSENIGLNSI